MSDFNLVVFYVADVARSQAFYAELFGRPARESSPGFAMFEAAPGVRLGLWRANAVQPPANPPGGGEFCVAVTEAEVEPMARAWADRGVAIAQPPTRMDFGLTFVGLDPDGHRLRVLAPAD